MITISCKETLYTYNLYHMAKAFFPEAEIRQAVDKEQEPLVKLVLDGGSCFSVMPDLSVGQKLSCRTGEPVEYVEKPVNPAIDKNPTKCVTGASCRIPRNEKKKQVTQRIYDCLSSYTGKKLAWGTLTGVRPVKLAMGRLESGDEQNEIIDYMQREYKVSEEKARLAAQIAYREKILLSPLNYQDGFSLYIGIPFCPSICTYCSFSSSPVGLWKERIPDYLDALFREIKAIGEMTAGKKLDTVYIGGGTPVTLEAGHLERLLSLIEETFPDVKRSTLQEYTVEAGRPDSITREKLETLRMHRITRISVNPQTMQQKTLDRIGRRHTVEDVKKSFALARELGFDNINMDLIAGLPGEDASDMRDTLRQIEALCPDSLTVHALAIKRAAQMGQEKREERIGEQHTEISQMIRDSESAAGRMGMVPYYLYRQKNIAGNFENVGYAKVDKAGIYNILIMEEKQTILAAGAGTTTKIVLPEKIRLENGKETNLLRMENVKDITEYIGRTDEMIKRKKRVWSTGHFTKKSC